MTDQQAYPKEDFVYSSFESTRVSPMNNRKIVFALMMGLFIASSVFVFFKIYRIPGAAGKTQSVVDTTFKEPVLAIYNDQHHLTVLKSDSLDHVYLKLDQYADERSIKDLIPIASKHKSSLVSVELLLNSSGNNILKEILDGSYDDTIKALCNAIKGENKVYLRWAPEMEVPVKRYPWQYQSPVLYIEAFRYLAVKCKGFAKNIQIVWGPAGYPGTEEYWPGAEVVDFVSITLKGKSEGLTNAYPKINNIVVDMKRKLHRLRFTDKPVFILGDGKIKRDSLFTNEWVKISFSGGVPDTANFRHDKPLIGVYDPGKVLVNAPSVKVEHIFIDLAGIEDGTFLRQFNEVIQRNHDVIITVEPLRDKKIRKESNVLINTINGVYDEAFNTVYKAISAVKQTVYLRFAHEMEIPIHRYPWQSQDPVLYIKAFRYFMLYPGKDIKNVKRVWGPAGDRGSMEWWPGGDVVDYISIAIYGLPDKDITDQNKQESFEEIYNRKFYRMRFMEKPIFVTEFGVKGSDAFQQRWLIRAASVINRHKEIYGVCYFNLADNPKVWGKIPAPNWGVSKASFNSFADRLSAAD